LKVGFRQSFAKDVAGVKDKSLLRRVKVAIEAVEKAESLSQISGLKKLKGGGNYYRLRIGDFRIGLAVEAGEVIFVRFINRKDMYRYFP
jgi:mRNA interferase RelE/StbE